MNCQILVCLQFVILANLVLCNSDSLFETSSANSSNKQCGDLVFCKEFNYGPHSPYVPCSYLPLDFLECDELQDHQGNISSLKLAGHGCLNFGGQNHNDVFIGSRVCHVLTDIECYGNRTVIRDGFPCLHYKGYYFITTLLFSLLLGFLGMDRFYLGHTGTAIGKLLTIGGVGVWWIVDIILLITGNLMPEDGSNWMPYA